MRSKTSLVLALSVYLAGNISAQTVDPKAIEKQQAEIARRVQILHYNFQTFWMVAFPSGATMAHDNRADREAAWNPKLDENQKNATRVNDGLGCISFLTKNGQTAIPPLCAPVDVQARLAMEALREDWENGRIAPKGSMLETMRDSIPSLWAEEKTIYCMLQPNAQYIGLTNKLQSCTPKGKE
jgi:hypothetical protein